MAITDHLKIIHSNFSVGMFLHCQLRRLRPEDVAIADRVIVGEDGLYCVPRDKQIPPEAGDFYEVFFGGPAKWSIDKSAMEFAKMLLRNLTLDSYEVLFSYCEQTGQLNKMQAENWYA